MSEFFSRELRELVAMARKRTQRKASRLRVVCDSESYPVLRQWQGGFGLDADQVRSLRGHVDLYEGSRHLMRCLVVASEVQGGELVCTFKRATAISDRPALDYARDPDAPIGYLSAT